MVEVRGGVGDVVGIEGQDGADALDEAHGALGDAAQEMGPFDFADGADIGEIHSGAVAERGLLRGVRQRPLDRGGRSVSGGIALLAGGGQELLGLLHLGPADVGALGGRLHGAGARVVALRHFGVVGVRGRVVRLDLGNVGVVGLLLRFLAGLVQGDGLLGLALRPGHRLRVRLQRLRGTGARVRGVRPLAGVHRELLAEGVRALALPVAGVQPRHALADAVEGGGEVLQVGGGGPDFGRVAVDELVGLLGLAQLFLVDMGAHVGGEFVAEVVNGVGRTVKACAVQRLADLVGGPVDAFADLLLAFVPEAFGAFTDLVDAALEAVVEAVENVAHSWAPAPRCCCASLNLRAAVLAGAWVSAQSLATALSVSAMWSKDFSKDLPL